MISFLTCLPTFQCISLRFIYSAFLTVVCLACPAIVIWLDPWQWKWPNMAFLISGNTASLVFVWLVGPLFWPYFLFQTGVGYFRVYAMCSGLMGSKKSKGWKVSGVTAGFCLRSLADVFCVYSAFCIET